MGRFRHSASHKNLPNWVRNCIGRCQVSVERTQPEVFDQFAVDAGHGVDIVAKCDSSAVDQVGVEPVMGFDQCEGLRMKRSKLLPTASTSRLIRGLRCRWAGYIT